MRASLALCHLNHDFMFRVRPDLFPHDRLTLDEILLWQKFLEEREKSIKGRTSGRRTKSR